MSSPDTVQIPDALPVMVLSGATLFPHSYMPLFIFEQRYRDMLAYALERDRMFCVGHAPPGIDPDDGAEDAIRRLTTAGLIRACVTHEDGTSHLMLAGLRRVEIVGWVQRAPFRIASVIPLPDLMADDSCAALTALDVMDLCARLCENGKPMSPQLREQLECVGDLSAVADVVAQSFVSDPEARQNLLETLDTGERLSRLAEHLKAMLAGEP